jgi:ABC transporter substrate binding protein
MHRRSWLQTLSVPVQSYEAITVFVLRRLFQGKSVHSSSSSTTHHVEDHLAAGDCPILLVHIKQKHYVSVRNLGDRSHNAALFVFTNMVYNQCEYIVGHADRRTIRTVTIPIVFVQVSDPVAQGFVSNLTHPGGNITGFTSFEPSIAGKWLDFLKRAVPSLSRVAVIFNLDTSPQSKLFVPVLKSSASSFAVEVIVIPVHAIADFEPAIANFSRHPNSGLIFSPDQFAYSHRGFILELVARYGVPAIYGSEAFARDGGLIYYGFDEEVQFRQAAIYADRILKGANQRPAHPAAD